MLNFLDRLVNIYTCINNEDPKFQRNMHGASVTGLDSQKDTNIQHLFLSMNQMRLSYLVELRKIKT